MLDEETSALLRTDVLSFLQPSLETIEPSERFIPSWHLQTMAYHLKRVELGLERRLIFNLPPRSLKTVTVSVAFVAFMLGRNPSLKIIVVSATQELARKHAANFRRLVSARWYRILFPAFELARDGDRLIEQKTTKNGYRYATSIGAGITGQGADIIIIDDPNKAQEIHSEPRRRAVNEFYGSTLYSRLTNKTTGVVILVQQRLHSDDLTGHLLGKSAWTHVAIPAIAIEDATYPLSDRNGHVLVRKAGDILQPERNSSEVMEEARAILGSLNFEAQYQQNPTPRDGHVIKRQWLRFYDQVPTDLDFTLVSWDTASSLGENADYSVGTVWGRKRQDFYLIDLIRGRFEPSRLRRLIERTEFDYKANVTLVEKTELGGALGSEMRFDSSIRPILITPRFDKISRLEAQAPKFEAGQVLLPREASWLGIYLDELLGFPHSAHDDQVDSTSQALYYFARHMARTPKASTGNARTGIKARPHGKVGSRA